jgi:hypothetical protein
LAYNELVLVPAFQNLTMSKLPYCIGYGPAFVGFGKFTEAKPTVNLCPKCTGFAATKTCFEPDYEVNEKICPKHYNQNVSALLGEQLVAA